MKFLVPLIALVMCSYAAFCQSNMNNAVLKTDYVKEYYTFKKHYENQRTGRYSYAFGNTSGLSVTDKIDAHLTNYYQKNYCVSLNSSYLDNFGSVIGDLGLFYNRALQTGLEWNILKDGYFDRKQQFKSQSNYYKAKIYSAQRNQASDLLLRNKVLIDSIFEIANKVHLIYYDTFLEKKKEVYRNLYSRKLTTWTELINLDNHEANIRLKLDNLQTIQRDDTLFKKIINSKFYRLAIDNFSDFALDSAIYYKARTYKQETTFLQNVSLKTSVRYNYFNYDAKELNRDFVSVGVGLSIPIFSKLKDLNALNKINADFLEYESKSVLLQQQQTLYELIRQYNIVLEELINIKYTALVIDEDVRKELVKKNKQDPDFSPVAILNFTHDHYENAGNFLFQKHLLDKLALQISTIVGEEKFANSLKEIDFSIEKPASGQNGTETNGYNIKTQNAVYIWSKTFDKYSISQMLTELKLMNANKAVISINKSNDLKVKLLDFAKAAKQQKIETIGMIGKNSFIYPENKAAMVDEINYLLEIPNIKEIHLDVEPHTIAALKKDRDKYLTMYINMLKYAKEAIAGKNVKLSVSIPLFYDGKYLPQIIELVDNIYLMTYEHVDIDFINRKKAEERRIAPTKVIMAVRTKDFQSRAAMFDFMNKLSESSDRKDMAIHDLESWLTIK